MKVVTSREFNQDVSHAKRLASYEPVLVTDRGKPTHVLMSIEAFREMSGQYGSVVSLLAAPPGSPALDRSGMRIDLGGKPARR